MHARTILTIGATPQALFPASRTLALLTVQNTDGATGAYVKIWRNRSAAPAADSAPDLVLPAPSGVTTIPLFAVVEGASWISCTQEATAAGTAPASAVHLTLTWEPL